MRYVSPPWRHIYSEVAMGVMCFDRIEAGIDADAIQKFRVFCIVSLDVVGGANNIFLSFTYKKT